jgi:hypothetical protein
MSTLAELQRAFARGLAGDVSGADDWISAGAFPSATRLQIYRHNVDAIFTHYLQAAFPAVERLVGVDYFAGLARAYREACPSPSGNLHDCGGRLPEFLDAQLQDSAHAYIGDVARLEWAYQEALVAADAAAFDVAGFVALAPEQHETLRFAFAPSVRHVRSPYPIQAIWDANRVAGVNEMAVDWDAGGDALLLHRVADQVVVRRLDPGTDAFVAALMQGATLAEGIAALERIDPSRDASTLLFEFIQSARIDGFQLP